MRQLLSAIAISAGLAAPLSAGADQTHPNLDSLFDIIQTSDSIPEIRAAEQLIWLAWMEHENGTYAIMLRDGTQAMNEGKLDLAVELFTELVEEAPEFAEAWNKRATVYFLQGRLDRSAADVDRTLALEPRHFGALSGLGQIEMLRGDGKAAIAAFEGALEQHPYLPGLPDLIAELKKAVRGQPL